MQKTFCDFCEVPLANKKNQEYVYLDHDFHLTGDGNMVQLCTYCKDSIGKELRKFIKSVRK